MPKRTDIKKILIIGSGPIIISQACEFDYSGTQAVKALKEEGYEVVLINSNPATIMTDPELADKTYIEPITPEMVAKVIEKERPDALLPTLGGQTGLNTAIKVAEMGVLKKYGVELLAADINVIRKAEGREEFLADSALAIMGPIDHTVINFQEGGDYDKLLAGPARSRPLYLPILLLATLALLTEGLLANPRRFTRKGAARISGQAESQPSDISERQTASQAREEVEILAGGRAG